MLHTYTQHDMFGGVELIFYVLDADFSSSPCTRQAVRKDSVEQKREIIADEHGNLLPPSCCPRERGQIASKDGGGDGVRGLPHMDFLNIS